MRDKWLKLSAKNKAEFINSYNEKAEMNSRLASRLLSEPIPTVATILIRVITYLDVVFCGSPTLFLRYLSNNKML